ncbi:hypothetical protein AVEN_119806-1 [Araneus ventricosus]|uniref:Uncharacterized protein n=1 Tax=Araneus ventricosus TaxID=182803 RepID=A0A4Y2KRN1_ARAVE|nr:hypothetical protein AVEN_258473-1 [Araneus ventricosus]GBN04211.1 hypothetical protein AVEN_62328-1 [Araneus ventricosus]GBN04235.1 hypothetical protein AVEN_114400-1 [Araneus ventricosus]GBN04244.1 hypothetical protein AVEN_119806-1 [Araneus ventricosus]
MLSHHKASSEELIPDICFPFEHEVDLGLIELRDPRRSTNIYALYRYYAYGLPSDIVKLLRSWGQITGCHRSQVLREAKLLQKKTFHHRCCQQRSIGKLLKAGRHAGPFLHSFPNLRGSPRCDGDAGEKTPSVFTAFSFFQCQKRFVCPAGNKIPVTPKKGPLLRSQQTFLFFQEWDTQSGRTSADNHPRWKG